MKKSEATKLAKAAVKKVLKRYNLKSTEVYGSTTAKQYIDPKYLGGAVLALTFDGEDHEAWNDLMGIRDMLNDELSQHRLYFDWVNSWSIVIYND